MIRILLDEKQRRNVFVGKKKQKQKKEMIMIKENMAADWYFSLMINA